MYKERAYGRRNAQVKRFFFAEFTHDKEKHAEILRARALRKEIKRLLNTDVPYAPATGLLEPKPEPVDEAPGAYSFMYIGYKMTSCKTTDRSRHSLQGRNSKPISEK